MPTKKLGPGEQSPSRGPSPGRSGQSAGPSETMGAEASILFLLAMAGLGGILPTLSRIAAFYVANPTAPLPAGGFYVGVFCFFLIGSVIGFALAESNARRAVLVGIAAPAIITNVAQGVSEGGDSKRQDTPPRISQHLSPIAPQYALHRDSVERLFQLVGQRSSSGYVIAQQLTNDEFPEEITIEAQMPTRTRGSLNTDIIFIYAAPSDGEWQETPVADVGIGNSIQYQPSPGIRKLGFVAGEATAAIDLTPGFTGRICLALDTQSRGDFLWALGFRRSTTITSITPKLADKDSCSTYFASENESPTAASDQSVPASTMRLDRSTWLDSGAIGYG